MTTPVGAFLRTIFLRFAASSPALRSAASFSISHSGAITTTVPDVSYPARPARPGDLVELARRELAHPRAVVLRQRGDHHRADGHVDADAERVGAADHAQQSTLRERLDEPAVPREHARVVHADPGSHVARQDAAERRREAEPADRLGDGVALLAARRCGSTTAPAPAPWRRPARSARCTPAPRRSAAAPRPSRAPGVRA